jgi:hypothetical protein
MGDVTVTEATTEEQPYYYDFKKREVMGYLPTMANVTYDPFPKATDDDVVRTEIISTKIILRAKIKAPEGYLKGGMAIDYQGQKFAISNLTESFDAEGDKSLFEVEAFSFATQCEPLEALAKWRAALAANNPPVSR